MNLDLLLTSDYVYQGNCPGKFKNNLPSQIELSQNAKVCLKSISYINSYNLNLFEIHIKYYDRDQYDYDCEFTQRTNRQTYAAYAQFVNPLYNYRFKLSVTYEDIKKTNEEFVLYVEKLNMIFKNLENQYKNEDHMSVKSIYYLFDKIQNKSIFRFFAIIMKHTSQKLLKDFQNIFQEYLSKYVLALELLLKKIILKNQSNYFHTEKITIVAENIKNDYLQIIETEFKDNRFFEFFDDKLVKNSYFINFINFEVITDFPKNIFIKDDEISFRFEKNLILELDTFYIYSNIISNTLCPHIQEPLLKLLKVSSNKVGLIEKVFKRPNYISINKSVIANIEIIIKDKNNKIIEFKEGPTICELEIREK